MFELWDINAAAFELFLSLESQWRVLSVGMSGHLVWLGLDYQGVDVLMRRRCIADEDGVLFADLQVLEAAAVAAFAEIGR